MSTEISPVDSDAATLGSLRSALRESDKEILALFSKPGRPEAESMTTIVAIGAKARKLLTMVVAEWPALAEGKGLVGGALPSAPDPGWETGAQSHPLIGEIAAECPQVAIIARLLGGELSVAAMWVDKGVPRSRAMSIKVDRATGPEDAIMEGEAALPELAFKALLSLWASLSRDNVNIGTPSIYQVWVAMSLAALASKNQKVMK